MYGMHTSMTQHKLENLSMSDCCGLRFRWICVFLGLEQFQKHDQVSKEESFKLWLKREERTEFKKLYKKKSVNITNEQCS